MNVSNGLLITCYFGDKRRYNYDNDGAYSNVTAFSFLFLPFTLCRVVSCRVVILVLQTPANVFSYYRWGFFLLLPNWLPVVDTDLRFLTARPNEKRVFTWLASE